jgi:hypothetical protein
VYAAHPHGVFPFGQWLSVPSSCDAQADATDAAVLRALPTRMRGGVASVLLHVPMLRHLMAWAGMAPAARDTVSRLLARGISVVLIPGGIAEVRSRVMDIAALMRVLTQAPYSLRFRRSSSLVPTVKWCSSAAATASCALRWPQACLSCRSTPLAIRPPFAARGCRRAWRR